MSRMSALLWNPIVAREARTRMRGSRALVLLVAFVGAVGVMTWGSYAAAALQTTSVAQTAHAGVIVFAAMVGALVTLITLLVPGLVGGSIASERERQTLDMLLSTPVRPWRIVVGKLVGSLLFVLFLLVAALPILSVVALLGGVDGGDIAVVALVGVVTTITFGCVAIFFSTALRRAASAIVCSYIATFLLYVVPLLAGAFLLTTRALVPGVAVSGGGFASSGPAGGPAVHYPQQVVTTGPTSGFSGAAAVVMSLSPGTAMAAALAPSQSCVRTIVATQGGFGSSGVVTMPATYGCATSTIDQFPAGLLQGWHAWQVFLVFATVLSGVSVLASVAVLRGRVPWARARPAVPV